MKGVVDVCLRRMGIGCGGIGTGGGEIRRSTDCVVEKLSHKVSMMSGSEV